MARAITSRVSLRPKVNVKKAPAPKPTPSPKEMNAGYEVIHAHLTDPALTK